MAWYGYWFSYLWAPVSLLSFSWTSLAYLLSLDFLDPLTNSAFPWAFTNFIGLPWLNYLILIIGIHGPAINPLTFFVCITLGLWRPFLTFLHHILPMGMLFLSFWASLSPLTSSRPICLFHGFVIYYSCRLGLMVLSFACQFFAAFVVGLFFFLLGFSQMTLNNIYQ